MNFFNIDFQKFIAWLTPFKLRKLKFLAFLEALLSQIKSLHDLLLEFRVDAKKGVLILNQTGILEYALRDLLSIQDVRIINQNFRIRNHTYFVPENSTNKLITQFKGESSNDRVHTYFHNEHSGASFTIYFLDSYNIAPELSKIKAFVDKYKLPSATYEIRQVAVLPQPPGHYFLS